MKRLFLLATIIAIVSSASYAATLQRTILSHKGNLTQYDANHWQEAINDAVAGDTVFFTSGYFAGELTITKPITLIGAGVAEDNAFWTGNDPYWYNGALADVYAGCAKTGESTRIDGNVSINIPGKITLTKTLMEGFLIYRDPWNSDGASVFIEQEITGVIIKRCQIGWLSASAKSTNMVLENCFFNGLSPENWVEPNIHNCVIGQQIDARGTEGLEFTNCMLNDLLGAHNYTFVNCTIGTLGDANYYSTHNTYVNCIYQNSDGNSTYTNCWQNDSPNLFNKAQLQSGGYIGTDGTVVGPLGGVFPFTLIPSQPYVSSSTMTYNKSTKKLNVNVTIKQGK